MEFYLFIGIGIIFVFLNYFVIQKTNFAIQKTKRNLYIFSQSTLSESPERFGAKLGLKLSLILSTSYAFIGILVVQPYFGPAPTKSDELMFLVILLLGLLFSILSFAILPAIIYGVVTGYLLGLLIVNFKYRRSSLTFILLGIALCTMVTTLSHVIFNIHITLSFGYSSSILLGSALESYPFRIGIPSIIYILSGGWASWYVFKKFNVKAQVE